MSWKNMKILIVEDNIILCGMIEKWLQKAGYEVLAAIDEPGARNILKKNEINLVLGDVRLPEGDGISLLEWMMRSKMEVPFIVMTDYACIKDAVRAIKLGAKDYLQKPVHQELMIELVHSMLKQPVIVRKERSFVERTSEAARKAASLARRVAPSDLSVMILGPSGSGKEVIAQMIHRYSDRRDKPFVAVNCGSIPNDLQASEFFGAVKGAFTGAVADRKGHFETANGGTLFLDEIGNMPYSMQILLLRVLQEKEFNPVGSDKVKRTDVRIISATNEDMKKAVEEGRFREDLYYRLAELEILQPALKECKDDILPLAEFFRKEHSGRIRIKNEGFTEEAKACMLGYDISDAYEASYTIMLNLNKTWIEKQGDFFVESPIILLAAIIWYLKIYKNGIYCSFPHAVELLNKPYSDLFTILTSYPELENYLSPFMDAWKGGAQDQLQGQIASAKIPLTRMISPQLYWVMTGNDFSLDINNPKEPKILCVGNNPDRQNIYSAALGLYNSRIVKLINKKGQLKSTVIIDELPTIYFRGLDNLIATARSNKVAVCLGFQDFSQLNRDYGEKESKVIQNTVGNIFSGQVVGETAKTLSERFGKILQKRQSISINRQDVSTSINTQLDSLIPASKISNLSQGTFVGSVSDNFGEKIDQKIFHAEIIVDHAKVSAEEKAYKKIPVINTFKDSEGNDIMLQQIQRNYDQIKADAQAIINDEMERIKNDPELCERLGIESAEEDKRKTE